MEAAYRESLEDCDGEELPNILLADLGKQIGREYEPVGRVENKRRFALIEAAVGDEGELGTAVTTGLIEALVGEAERRKIWQPIFDSFGTQSRAYIEAWFAQQESIARTIAFG